MIYLASNSLRRRDLLEQIGISYKIWLPDQEADRVDETPYVSESPIDYVKRIAREKAELGWQRLSASQEPTFPVLAADTTVSINQQILGKPRDSEEARYFLRSLSGNTHEVLTAVVIRYQDKVLERLNINTVHFKELTDQDIEWYIKTGEFEDKAGGYALQGHAACFVTRIEGSPSGIVGLPLYETMELIRLISS